MKRDKIRAALAQNGYVFIMRNKIIKNIEIFKSFHSFHLVKKFLRTIHTL